MLQEICDALARGWLAREAWVYVECSADAALPALPPHWAVHRTKRAGQVGYHLLRVSAPS
jgi:16S rRNA (guanine966-N2)-methyltransferase